MKKEIYTVRITPQGKKFGREYNISCDGFDDFQHILNKTLKQDLPAGSKYYAEITDIKELG